MTENVLPQTVFARLGGQWKRLLLVAAVVALYFFSTRPPPLLEGWLSDYDAARAEAETSGRNMLVAFNMAGCGACTSMDRTVLTHSDVKSALKGFVPVRIDVTRERRLTDRFDVIGTPTYAVVDPTGAVLSSCVGYQPVERFVEFLGRASHLPAPSP